MYENFYGLKEKPFALVPDSAYMYMSDGHARALTLLRYSVVGRQGFTVITGEIGAGKTTLINRLLDGLDRDVAVGLLNFTEPGAEQLHEWIAMAFGLEYRDKSRVELYEDFIVFLADRYAQGKHTVLIIDEAQNLVISGLEKVRMLSNVNAEKDYLLHLILVGQPQLRSLLGSPQLEQFAQRVSVSYHLERLTAKDAKAYILHRLKIAGAEDRIFSPQALRILAEASGGVPRVINTLCDLALVYGYSAGKHLIDARIAKSVLADREQMGLKGSLAYGARSISTTPAP